MSSKSLQRFPFKVEYVCVFQDSRNAQGSIQAM